LDDVECKIGRRCPQERKQRKGGSISLSSNFKKRLMDENRKKKSQMHMWKKGLPDKVFGQTKLVQRRIGKY
jgi:hypothetical protein